MFLLQETKKLVRKNHKVNCKTLPKLFFFTDRNRFADIFSLIKSFSKSADADIAIIVREYDLSRDKRMEFAKKIIEIAKEKSFLVLIGKDLKMALELKADGVHFSDKDKNQKKCFSFRVRKDFIFTYSIHSTKSLKEAKIAAFDVIFYSPIFSTKSHLNQKPVGVRSLSKIALKSKIPLYALGGINLGNLRQLKNCHISGIAGISLFAL